MQISYWGERRGGQKEDSATSNTGPLLWYATHMMQVHAALACLNCEGLGPIHSQIKLKPALTGRVLKRAWLCQVMVDALAV